jgi:hypothetical protein
MDRIFAFGGKVSDRPSTGMGQPVGNSCCDKKATYYRVDHRLRGSVQPTRTPTDAHRRLDADM